MAAIELDWAVPLFERAKDSVCFVVISPRPTSMNGIKKLAMEMANENEHPDNQSDRCAETRVSTGIKKLAKQVEDRCAETRVSTGFFVGRRGSCLLILTTAHSIDHVYNGSKPIYGHQANGLFQASILCDHYEFAYRDAGHARLTSDRREYVAADIIRVNSRRDLLLIAVERESIKREFSDLMCPGPHPNLEISRNLETAGEKCMLLSWPIDRHRRVATGCVGVRRNVREVSRPNKLGYNMEILEANISSEEGSSGAPLFNKSGDVIGVLHGGFGTSHSYFIPANLILDFLALSAPASDQRRKVEVEKKRKGKEIMGGGEESGHQHKHRRLR